MGRGEVTGRKFSYSNNPQSDFFIKNLNLTKKNSGGWERRGWGCGYGQ